MVIIYMDKYKKIQADLNAIWGAIPRLPLNKLRQIVFMATTFSILTIRQDTITAEKAFKHFYTMGWFSPLNIDAIKEYMYKNKMNYSIIKSGQIKHNYDLIYNTPKIPLLKLLNDRDLSVKTFKGIAYAKVSFSLAMLGNVKYCCLDSHVLRFLNPDVNAVDKISKSIAHSKKKYENLEKHIINLANKNKVSPFIMQWQIFDSLMKKSDSGYNPGQITHKVYFDAINDIIKG